MCCVDVGIIRNCPQGFYNVINSPIKCFQEYNFRQHPVIKCPSWNKTELVSITFCHVAYCYYFVWTLICVFKRQRNTMSLLLESLSTWRAFLFCLFLVPRINISIWEEVMRPIGGFFVVLTEHNCGELFWRRWALFLTGQSVARRYQGLICLKISRFVKFVHVEKEKRQLQR